MASNDKEHRSGQFSDPQADSPENSPHFLTYQLLALCKANATKEEKSQSGTAAGGTVSGTSSGQQQSNGPQDVNGHQQIEQPPLKISTGWRGRGRTRPVRDQPLVIGLPLTGTLRSPSPQQMYNRGSHSLNAQLNIYARCPELVNGQRRIDPCQPQKVSGFQQTNGQIKLGSNPRQQINGGPQIETEPPQQIKDGPQIDFEPRQHMNGEPQNDPEPPQQINGQSKIQTHLINVPAPSQPEVAVPKPHRDIYVPPQRRNGGGSIYQNPPDQDMPPRGPNYRDFLENRQRWTPESTPADEDDNWRQRK